jgi:endonuclease/exonuclease/phosphatase family metal-dependent hydrolase
MRQIIVLLLCLLWLGTPGYAQTPRVGDTVLLVERDIHIPAHPAPGDSAVPFRFVSGSLASVLAIDLPTSWLQIRGERLGGSDATGWITRTFVASVNPAPPSDPPQPLELSWCPRKGSQAPRPGRLRVATWNLANLHSIDGQSTFGGSDPSERRFAVDYERIRCYVRLFDPDILAVQEVDGVAALRRVVDTDVYDVHVESRSVSPGMNGAQNTGFAYKRELTVQRLPDVRELDVSSGALRRGARVDVTFGGETLSLMSVHLKSGCFDNNSSGSACSKLLEQIPKLEQWIDDAANGPHPVVVLGDFNRRLTLPGDDVWANLDDGQPANADLLAVTEDMPISCRDNTFTEFIDHIVVDKRAAALVDRSSFRHVTFRQADKAVWGQISDHCPVVVEMWSP